MGRLARARRWDMSSPPAASAADPSGTADVELRYAYDATDDRVRKTAVDPSTNEVHTLYVFDSLELRRAPWVERLKELNGPVGYRNVAFDLMTLAAIFREAWPRVEGKTPLQLDQLDRAEVLADRMLTAIGERQQSPTVVIEAGLQRQRAFTLLVRAYDQVRRVVAYLRWNEDDADRIAPSLYANRGPRRKANAKPEVLPPAEQPTLPAQPAVVAPTVPHIAGLPGGDPFAN